MNIGYKLLTNEGRSLSTAHGAVHYDLTGEWQSIPGSGAFVGLSVPGLLRGGFGPLLAEVEYRGPLGGDRAHVKVREVRIVRMATIDRWTLARVACRAARDVAHLNSDPRAHAAIEAAERCERERTTEAEMAALEAAEATSPMAPRGSLAPRESRASMLSWWAAAAAARAAAARRTTGHAATTNEIALYAADAAGCAARVEAAWVQASMRILGYLVADVWPTEAAS